MNDWRSGYVRMTVEGPESTWPSLLYWGLCPLSFFYGLIMRIRSSLYRAGLKSSYRASVPVISIGNMVIGGTGKTPMVDYLVRYISRLGVRCAVVSRGYGGSYRQDVARVKIADGTLKMTAVEFGDEPSLLAKRNPGVPVYVARKKSLGVQAAERDGVQLILLDDGFQHLAVHRDVDIVLLDEKRPFGNGRLLPAGILREPRSALQRADVVVMTRSSPEMKSPLYYNGPVLRSCHQLDKTIKTLDGSVVPESDYRGKRCLAFAGIARPKEFFQSLRNFGFSNIEEIPLSDHQEYNQDILNRLLRSCDNHDLLITTEKDAVKLSAEDFPKPCYKVGVEMVFDDFAPLAALLDEVMQNIPTSSPR
jgi:tetraacyldisaccharide 4'-kinase